MSKTIKMAEGVSHTMCIFIYDSYFTFITAARLPKSTVIQHNRSQASQDNCNSASILYIHFISAVISGSCFELDLRIWWKWDCEYCCRLDLQCVAHVTHSFSFDHFKLQSKLLLIAAKLVYEVSASDFKHRYNHLQINK